MTIKEQLHELFDELDDDSAGEALAYLQSRHRRYGAGAVRPDVTAAEQDAAAMDTWEDEGGGQTGRAVDERSSAPSKRPVTDTC